MNHEESSSSGVQELIERLHEEGLSKGQDQAEQLISKAREQAAEILEKAKSEADKILAAAISEAQQTRIAGEEAVRLAGRDTILRLNEELRADLAGHHVVLTFVEIVGNANHDAGD